MKPTQAMLDQAKAISSLCHSLETANLEALAIQGELLAQTSRFCITSGMSEFEARKALAREKEALISQFKAVEEAGATHRRIEATYNERMDGVFDCPPDIAEAGDVVKLKVAS